MGAWRGTVRLHTKGGQSRDLLDRLAAWIGQENDRMGLRPEVKISTPPVPRPSGLVDAAPLNFAAEPVTDFDYRVA
jgi:hypothetical protein